MPKHSKNSEYYAVIRGFYITVPTIFSSWGDAHTVATGFSKSGLQGFETLEEAERYLDSEGLTLYNYVIKHGGGKTNPVKGQQAYYAVANGRTPGIQEYYYGKWGTEPEIVNFPHACHKHFRTKEQAKSFISDWIKMFACVAKDNIIKELLDGHRPGNMQQWPLQFKLRKDIENVEYERCADNFSQ